MGIFSGLKKAFSGENTFDKLLRARAISEGDWGSAAQITGGMRNREAGRRNAEADAQNKAQVFQALIEQGATPQQAIVMLQNMEATGKAGAEAWGESTKPRQFGPEGGSVATPDGKGGYNTAYSAQAWQNGSLFGGAQGGATPQILIEGEKAIPVEAGGAIAGVKPYSGGIRPIMTPNYGQGEFGQPAGGGGEPERGVDNVPEIPTAAIRHLLEKPELWRDFDAKYGAGAARRALGVSN